MDSLLTVRHFSLPTDVVVSNRSSTNYFIIELLLSSILQLSQVI